MLEEVHVEVVVALHGLLRAQLEDVGEVASGVKAQIHNGVADAECKTQDGEIYINSKRDRRERERETKRQSETERERDRVGDTESESERESCEINISHFESLAH